MMGWLKGLMVTGSVGLFTIVDGDTLRLSGGQLVRLQGFNTPELHAECYAERTLAYRAKARLNDLIRQGAILRINPGLCGYGRACGSLLLDGVDVAETMIREGLAEPYVCVGNKCPKRRSWC